MIDSFENEARIRSEESEAETEVLKRFERLNQKHGGRFSTCDANYDDVCQAAREGTLMAHRRYDPEKGASLGTVAHTYSRGYAQNEGERRGSVMHNGPETVSEFPDEDELNNHTKYHIVVDSSLDPERAALTAELRAKFAQLVAGCREMDDLDRIIYHRRILTLDGQADSAADIADDTGFSREWIRKKELRLRCEVLPMLFAAFRDAA